MSTGQLLRIWFALVPVLVSPALAQLQPNSARDCAVCHLNWVDSFQRPRQSVLLMDPPGPGVVSESDMCLGCHDGGVGDDRRRVWLEHGHLTGIKPPPGMTVPPNLPLKNGELHCRTCHTAHAGQGPETLATTVFLRMPNETSQLCIACHSRDGYTGGEVHGAHPLGEMPWPLPPALAEAGAKAGPAGRTLTCQTCHEPHGAQEDHLLVMPTRTSELCLTCHTKIQTAFWEPGREHEHPQNPPLTDPVHLQAIKDMGTRVGDDQRLICLSCHQMHDARTEQDLLADTLQNSQLCVRCHPGYDRIFGSRHDLRVSAPQEQNLLGQTPQQSGPCGACHTFHHVTRERVPGPVDPSGLCATCHREGENAGNMTGLPFTHPVADVHQAVRPGGLDLKFYSPPGEPDNKMLACLTCHNPHETRHRDFLRVESSTLCATCHADQAESLGDPHDFTDRPDLINARGLSGDQAGRCGFCHGVHNAPGPALWTATKNIPKSPNDQCLECHSPTGIAQAVEMRPLRHPTGPGATMESLLALRGMLENRPDGATRRGPAEDAVPLVAGAPRGGLLPVAGVRLYDEDGRHDPNGFVACGSCHDPHGGADGNAALLRKVHIDSNAGLCAACHREAATLHASLHSDRFLRPHYNTSLCTPCHSAHETPGMPPAGMFSGPLGPEEQPLSMRQCTGCHAPGAHGRPVMATEHPILPMINLGEPGSLGWLPLFDETGHISPVGNIGCGTCHRPHGPDNLAMLPLDPDEATVMELRGLRTMLRPYVTPNVCSTCHGSDGRRRYLYFHDYSRRGPLPDFSGN